MLYIIHLCIKIRMYYSNTHFISPNSSNRPKPLLNHSAKAHDRERNRISVTTRPLVTHYLPIYIPFSPLHTQQSQQVTNPSMERASISVRFNVISVFVCSSSARISKVGRSAIGRTMGVIRQVRDGQATILF